MNIVITGASQGIGYATTLALAESGKHHIIAIARSKDGLAKLKDQLPDDGPSELSTISFDLAQKDYSRLITDINSTFNSAVDVLINNAAYLINKPFLELSDEDWQAMFEVNVFAVARLSRELFPYFNKKSSAHIVNIGSMGGVQGTEKFPGLSAYSTSKGAVNTLTEVMSKEFENDNIKVNCINPGAVQTEMLTQAFPGYQADVQPQDIAQYIATFATSGHMVMNGRLHEVSSKG
ncbi:SDR family NAD(P)-dependent oxidoreductase [Carboxylicivirga sp. N1Y90]|uniref:SDR family NAD(P)-dependent oxidoreductase n=1 Tax=Carboxylicivirga fragile TaxID=3417571 RepID=UPI003D34141D|nr:SDR family oxidoreductase [Marinilabiliaceae bacterium N1Y90]